MGWLPYLVGFLVFLVLIAVMVWDVVFRAGSDFPLPWRRK